MRSYGQYCSVAKALDVVGDRWTLLIVRELLLQGPCRYTDLKNGLPGIATNLLADRLHQLEEAGLVWREDAPPPVATTLFHLSQSGLELRPVLDALGAWGIRYMPEPADGDDFRSHWFAYPISLFVHDRDPDGPPLSIELHAGDRPASIEVSGGSVRTRLGTSPSPDLILDGSPRLILGLLAAYLTPAEALDLGLNISGDPAILRRLQPEPTPLPSLSPGRTACPAPRRPPALTPAEQHRLARQPLASRAGR